MVERLEVLPRRYASPFADQRAKLEPIHQPLYSLYTFAGATLAPGQALMFQYGVGGPTATNGTPTAATLLHTNLPGAGGVLPTPRVFLITGVRIVKAELSNISGSVIDDSGAYTTAGPTYVGNDLNGIEDLLRIVYGSVVELVVGTKSYLTAPAWITPGNTGVQGETSNVNTGGRTPTAPVALQNFSSQHSAGRYFALDRYPVLIPSQQNFSLALNFPQVNKPTFNGGALVYGVLDGILGREVM